MVTLRVDFDGRPATRQVISQISVERQGKRLPRLIAPSSRARVVAQKIESGDVRRLAAPYDHAVISDSDERLTIGTTKERERLLLFGMILKGYKAVRYVNFVDAFNPVRFETA